VRGLEKKVVGCGCEAVGCGWVGGVLCCGVEGGKGLWSEGPGVYMVVCCLPNLQTAQNKNQPEQEILEMEKIQEFTTGDQNDKFSKTEKIQKITKYRKTSKIQKPVPSSRKNWRILQLNHNRSESGTTNALQCQVPV